MKAWWYTALRTMNIVNDEQYCDFSGFKNFTEYSHEFTDCDVNIVIIIQQYC